MPIVNVLGRPLDEVILFIGILISFVLQSVLPFIRVSFLRKWYSTTTGVLLITYVYGAQILLLIPFNLISFFIMALLPRNYCLSLTLVVTGLLLTLMNAYEMAKGDLGFNISLLAMISFIKQMMIAANYQDGIAEASDLTSREKSHALQTLPSFFDYCHYHFCLTSAVIGPSFEYKEWDDFISLKGDFARMKMCGNLLPALSRFFQGLICT
jgi:hypothetical protein